MPNNLASFGNYDRKMGIKQSLNLFCWCIQYIYVLKRVTGKHAALSFEGRKIKEIVSKKYVSASFLSNFYHHFHHKPKGLFLTSVRRIYSI